MNPLCTSGCDDENTCHFSLHYPSSLAERNALLKQITNVHGNILNQADATITISGNSTYFIKVNLQILNASIDFILTSKRFDKPILNP